MIKVSSSATVGPEPPEALKESWPGGSLVTTAWAIWPCPVRCYPATLAGMGTMMGTGMGAWIFLWIVLGLAVVVTAGVVAARALSVRHPKPPLVPPPESPAIQEAKDIMRLRYATGEISREEYLQGQVELEDMTN